MFLRLTGESLTGRGVGMNPIMCWSLYGGSEQYCALSLVGSRSPYA